MDNQKISMPTEAEKQRAIAGFWMQACPPGRLWPGSCGRFCSASAPARAVWRGGLFGLVPADLGPVPAVGAFCGRFHRLFGTGPVPVFSPALCRPLPADCLEEPADRHLGVDLDLPGLRPDGGGPADAVLRRGVRTGVCPGKYAVVDLHRAGDAPGLDAGTVSGQPVSVWRSLPAVPAAAGTCRVAGGADRLGSDGPDSPDLAPGRRSG